MTRRSVHIGIALAMVFAATACSGVSDRAGAGAADTSVAAAGAVTPADSAAARATPPPNVPMAASGVPEVMGRAEGLAEDVQDDIRGADWSAAGARVSQLQALPDGLSATGTSAHNVSRFVAYVDSLDQAVTGRNRYPALRAANQVSRVMNQMMSDYPTRVPIEVAYMDVAGRDVRDDAGQGDWAGATEAAAELRDNYASVKAHVKASDSTLDNRISSQLSDLLQAIATKDVKQADALATNLLEEVDRIEQTY